MSLPIRCTPVRTDKDHARRPGPRERGYDGRWQQARAEHLRRSPLCVMCAAEGRTVKASVVDHVEPHKGDARRFWDRGRWQSLCVPHHSATKQQIERRGYAATVGADGLPTDPAHPFLQG